MKIYQIMLYMMKHQENSYEDEMEDFINLVQKFKQQDYNEYLNQMGGSDLGNDLSIPESISTDILKNDEDELGKILSNPLISLVDKQLARESFLKKKSQVLNSKKSYFQNWKFKNLGIIPNKEIRKKYEESISTNIAAQNMYLKGRLHNISI